MENEIKVGEYVRTPEQGFIGKLVEINKDVLNYYKIDVGREIRRYNGMSDNYIYSRDGFGLKHSTNLIDIIEVGDYVNGHKVIDASDTNKGCMREVYCEDDEDFGIWDEMIETVVTKEMMESISYKITKM